MITGKISFYNERKQYGFIKRDDGDKDCFVHVSEIWEGETNIPQVGQAVSFEVKEGDRGPQAVNVKVL